MITFNRRSSYYRWSTAALEDSEDTLCCSSKTLRPLLLPSPTTEISIWINTYTCHFYFYSQLILLLQDTPKFSLLFRKYLGPTALAVLCNLNTPTNNFSHLSSIRSSLVDTCISRKSSKYHSISKNPQQPIALEILAYFHYD